MSSFKVQIYPSVDLAVAASEFYAVNTSDFNKTQAKGQLVIGIKSKDGADVKIFFPTTWIPLDLSQYASLDDLKSATVFREYVRKGLITLITKDSYDALRQLPEYTAENERISKITKGFTEKVSNQVEIALNASSSPMIESGETVAIQETPLTSAIINADSNESAVREFNKNLLGLGLSELRTIASKAAPTSLVQTIAIELETLLTSGQIPSLNGSVENTQAYKDAMSAGPNITF